MSLTAGELTLIQSTADDWLPETATIKRPAASVPDGRGGQTESYSIVASNVPCRVMTINSVANKLSEVAERVTPTGTHKLTFAMETDVRTEDEIVIGSRTFRATFVYDRSLATVVRVMCVEI